MWHKYTDRERRVIVWNSHEDFASRFWIRVALVDGGCWEWRGTTDPDGYGILHRGKRKVRAHRISWQMANGPIPAGLSVLHRCDRRSCVNPAHLFLGRQRDNMADRHRKGRTKVPVRANGGWTGEMREVSA